MKLSIVCVRDIALGAFGQPFFQQNDAMAKRAFTMAVNDKRNEALYPIRNDLEFWKLGEYDNESGKINTKGMPEIIFNRGEAVNREEVEEE